MGYLTSLTAEERFFRNVDFESGGYPDYEDPLVSVGPDAGPCWMWIGGYNDNGYPRYHSRQGLGSLPYRISWFYLRGEIPKGLHLDHLCRRPGCVRPEHLEPVTPAENTRRSSNPFANNARKTHCSRGHLFDTKNTKLDEKGHRHCRLCSRMTNTRWAREKRERDRQNSASVIKQTETGASLSPDNEEEND